MMTHYPAELAKERASAEIAFRKKETEGDWFRWGPSLRQRLQRTQSVPPWYTAGVKYVEDLLVPYAEWALESERSPDEVETDLKDFLAETARDVFLKKLRPYEGTTDDGLEAAVTGFVTQVEDIVNPALAPIREELWTRHLARLSATDVGRTGTDWKAAVEAFISKMASADHDTPGGVKVGVKITKTDIWTAMGYTDRTEFERILRGDERNQKALSELKWVLNMSAAVFLRALNEKKEERKKAAT
jgi:hypothetical protein